MSLKKYGFTLTKQYHRNKEAIGKKELSQQIHIQPGKGTKLNYSIVFFWQRLLSEPGVLSIFLIYNWHVIGSFCAEKLHLGQTFYPQPICRQYCCSMCVYSK